MDKIILNIDKNKSTKEKIEEVTKQIKENGFWCFWWEISMGEYIDFFIRKIPIMTGNEYLVDISGGDTKMTKVVDTIEEAIFFANIFSELQLKIKNLKLKKENN